MIVTKNNFLVKEIKADLVTSSGLLVKYDDASDFIFVRIIEVGLEIRDKIIYQDKDHIVLVLNRINKRPFIEGQYFINENDILAIISDDEFSKLTVNA